MIVLDLAQRSPEWFVAKCGIPSSSNFDKIVDITGKPSKQRQKYLFQLAGERITGIAEETYQNAAMLRGIELEDEARKFYELVSGNKVEQCGLCFPDEKKMYGASPDGLVGKDGLVEIKCPAIHTQVGYLLDNKLPSDYIQQIQGQLLVTGRKWVDFVSYYPAIKPLIVRVERDKKFLAILEVELKAFCDSLDEIVEKIR